MSNGFPGPLEYDVRINITSYQMDMREEVCPHLVAYVSYRGRWPCSGFIHTNSELYFVMRNSIIDFVIGKTHY